MGEKNSLFKFLKKGHKHLFILLLSSSCVGSKGDSNEINIMVYAATATVNEVPVLLKVDEDVLVREELKPYREMYERVKVLSNPKDSVTVFYKEGDRDTTFTYTAEDKVSYLTIQYSEWWNKFFVTEADSASFYSGGNDVVY